MRTLILLVLLYACAPNPAYANARDRKINDFEDAIIWKVKICYTWGSKDEVLKCYSDCAKDFRDITEWRLIEEQNKLNQRNKRRY